MEGLGDEYLRAAEEDLRTADELLGWKPTPPIIEALKEGTEALAALIERGTDLNATGDYGKTALHVALERPRNREAAYLLVTRGADLNITDIYGHTPLTQVINDSRQESAAEDAVLVMLLMEYGADLAQVTGRGTALQVAYREGKSALVRLLRRHRAPFAAGESDTTPSGLMFAILEEDERAVRALLEQGAAIDQRDCDGWTPLHRAAWQGSEPITRLLLERGAEVAALVEAPSGEEPDRTGYRENTQDTVPLHFAAMRCAAGVVRLLLEAGADVNVWSSERVSPLATALDGWFWRPEDVRETVHLLLEYGADIEDLSEPLYDVAHLGDPEQVTFLLELGAGREQAVLQAAVKQAHCCWHRYNIEPLSRAGALLSAVFSWLCRGTTRRFRNRSHHSTACRQFLPSQPGKGSGSRHIFRDR